MIKTRYALVTHTTVFALCVHMDLTDVSVELFNYMGVLATVKGDGLAERVPLLKQALVGRIHGRGEYVKEQVKS